MNAAARSALLDAVEQLPSWCHRCFGSGVAGSWEHIPAFTLRSGLTFGGGVCHVSRTCRPCNGTGEGFRVKRGNGGRR